MTAVDTNVIVRLVTADDARQEAAARALFAVEPIWISKTVYLETFWVLRNLYGFEPSQIRDALVKLWGLPNVHSEDPKGVADALALTAHGVDFADAIHVTSRPTGASFVTFDKTSIKRARRAGILQVSAPPDW